MSCGCGGGGVGGCSCGNKSGSACDGSEQPLSPEQYWSTQRYLAQYQGCPRCAGVGFLAPVPRSTLGQTSVTTTTSAAPTTSIGTVVAIGVAAVAAGAALAYAITRHHDRRVR